jgi:hypothetical protein
MLFGSLNLSEDYDIIVMLLKAVCGLLGVLKLTGTACLRCARASLSISLAPARAVMSLRALQPCQFH